MTVVWSVPVSLLSGQCQFHCCLVSASFTDVWSVPVCCLVSASLLSGQCQFVVWSVPVCCLVSASLLSGQCQFHCCLVSASFTDVWSVPVCCLVSASLLSGQCQFVVWSVPVCCLVSASFTAVWSVPVSLLSDQSQCPWLLAFFLLFVGFVPPAAPNSNPPYMKMAYFLKALNAKLTFTGLKLFGQSGPAFQSSPRNVQTICKCQSTIIPSNKARQSISLTANPNLFMT